MKPTALSDEEVLANIGGLLGSERRILAKLLAHLIEVEKRRLDLKAACPSIFVFCVRRLGLSEGEAYRRIAAARVVRRFPSALDHIARGDIHLSALVLLRDHLTDKNHEELLALARGKTKAELQKALAARFPRPDVPTRIRKFPTRTPQQSPLHNAVDASAEACSSGAAPTSPSAPAEAERSVSDSSAGPAASPRLANASPPRAPLEPLSETRYKLQLTISADVREKLERATQLMSHRNPRGDLAVVLERALDLLIADLEKKKLGKSSRPGRRRPAKPGDVTRPVRREVFGRDGEQCSFVDDHGRRCPARSFIELDHRHPRALGGTGQTENIRVLCRAHNRLHAEEIFGRDHVEQQINLRRRKRMNNEDTKAKRDDTNAQQPGGHSSEAVSESAEQPNTNADMPGGQHSEAMSDSAEQPNTNAEQPGGYSSEAMSESAEQPNTNADMPSGQHSEPVSDSTEQPSTNAELPADGHYSGATSKDPEDDGAVRARTKTELVERFDRARASQALMKLGFPARNVRRALEVVRRRFELQDGPTLLEQIIREALVLLS